MPRPFFHRVLCLLLAALVLTASVGLTVRRHTCRISGRSTAQVLLPGRALAGCTGPLKAGQLKDGCCDVRSHLHKVSAPAFLLKADKLPDAPLLALWPEPLGGPALPGLVVALPQGAARWQASDSSPPPLGGRLLLRRTGRLQV